MRGLSTSEKADSQGQEFPGSAWPVLFTIEHADLPAPIYLTDYTGGITSRSKSFTGVPVLIEFPAQERGEFPRARWTLSIVDRTVLAQLRALATAPAVTLEIIRDTAPDTVVVGPWDLELSEYSITDQVLGGELTHEPILDEPASGRAYTPANLPGLRITL